MSDSQPEQPPPLERRSISATHSTTSTLNTRTLRLVPSEDPRLPAPGAEAGSSTIRRTPLPTHPSHFLSPGNSAKTHDYFYGFQNTSKTSPSAGPTGSSASLIHTAPQPSNNAQSTSGSSTPKPKYVPKKRLQLHKDNKTFSLVPQDTFDPAEDELQSSRSPALSTKSSYDFLSGEKDNANRESNSTTSCIPESLLTGSTAPSTPESVTKQHIPADPIASSPWNYQLVGGIRKVAKTPDTKRKLSTSTSESPLPPLPETSDVSTYLPQGLSTKQSFQSTQTVSTTSENTNYKVYGNVSPSVSESALLPPSSSDSNYQLLGEPSPSPSGSVIIHRPQTPESEFENSNYELHGDPSPTPSPAVRLAPQPKYSQESLVVAPLKPRTRQSNENLGLGYYKSRSRESLRTLSLNSISTVLSQKEAAKAIGGSGSLINLPPVPPKPKVVGSWAASLTAYPLQHMNEHPHQWSSQLSTVLSVSDGGTDRGSQSWSDDNGRLSGSGFVPSTPSRHSRQMLSISSSMASPIYPSDGDLEPPRAAYSQNRRHGSTSSAHIIEDLDEYGDGITNLQEMRSRPSRTRLSGFFSSGSSDNGRTNTMRSTASSTRTNSLLSSSLPSWAKVYYGSGERSYLGAPGSSVGGESRANSFRSGSPNTDHFPNDLYSPRRRPREYETHGSPYRRSDEITPVPETGRDGQSINDPYSRKFRTWSMSSIWSPHLRMDRRATRHSMWEPPSVNWSTEGGWYGRRNIQLVMFIVGFIFPFGKTILSCSLVCGFANLLKQLG